MSYWVSPTSARCLRMAASRIPVFAGRLVGQKGIEDIITALALTDQMPRIASESRRVHTLLSAWSAPVA